MAARTEEVTGTTSDDQIRIGKVRTGKVKERFSQDASRQLVRLDVEIKVARKLIFLPDFDAVACLSAHGCTKLGDHNVVRKVDDSHACTVSRAASSHWGQGQDSVRMAWTSG